MDIVLDTSTIIDIFGDHTIMDYLEKYEDKVFGITSITEFELFCADLKEKEVIMLSKLETLDFNRESARNAGLLFKDLKKRGRMPKIKDLMIVSICITNNRKLITGEGDFDIFRDYGLDVEIV